MVALRSKKTTIVFQLVFWPRRRLGYKYIPYDLSVFKTASVCCTNMIIWSNENGEHFGNTEVAVQCFDLSPGAHGEWSRTNLALHIRSLDLYDLPDPSTSGAGSDCYLRSGIGVRRWKTFVQPDAKVETCTGRTKNYPGTPKPSALSRKH